VEVFFLTRIAKVLTLAIASLALVAVGCGGGDDSTTTDTGTSGATGASGAPLTKEAFITQADAICKASGDAIGKQANQVFSGQQPSQAEVDQFANEVVVPGLREQLDGIRALTPPEGDEDQINAILDAVDEATNQVEADPSLLQASDNEGLFAQANQLAQDYGLKECGSD
jgi:hypothetical protein